MCIRDRYAGNIGFAQNLESIISAFKDINLIKQDILFTLMGDGVDKARLIKLVEKEGMNNVRFFERVSSKMVGFHLNAADALLVHLRDEPLFRITIPSKIIGYMYSGKPIMLGLNGDAQSIIEDSNCGVVFAPEDKDDFTEKMLYLKNLEVSQRQLLGFNARKYYDANFTIESGVMKYIELFNSVKNK